MFKNLAHVIKTLGKAHSLIVIRLPVKQEDHSLKLAVEFGLP